MSLTVLEECGLNLGGGETVTRNVDNIVNTATDPVVTIVITSSTISGELILVRLIFSNTKQ
jgi:hypothetical protein